MDGGQAALTGFAAQVVVALLDSLNLADWVTFTVEPSSETDEYEKVDIIWSFPDGSVEFAQVKRSKYSFATSQIREWALELQSAPSAKKKRLILVGSPAAGGSNLGNSHFDVAVEVVPDNIDVLLDACAHRIHRLLEQSHMPSTATSCADASTSLAGFLLFEARRGRTWRRAEIEHEIRRIGHERLNPAEFGGNGSANINYILVSGWEGMRELCSGIEGLVSRSLGYRILDAPALAEIVRATSSVARSDDSNQDALDWARLKELGAPVGNRRWSWSFREHMRRCKVPDHQYLLATREWFDIDCGTCGGENALDSFFPSSFRPSQRRTFYEWIRKSLPSRTSELDLVSREFELPILRAREPEAICLALHHHLPTGSRLRVTGPTFTMPDIVVDQRPILLPLGWRFSDWTQPREAPDDSDLDPGIRRSEQVVCDPTDEGNDLDDGWIEVRREQYEGPPLDELATTFLGASFVPTSLQAWDASGASIAMPDVRRPYAVREFLTVGLFGMSCPEVFVRRAGGAWAYWGPVLVNADSPSKSRSEHHVISEVASGEELEVTIREVRGET